MTTNLGEKKGLILVVDDEEDLRDMVQYQFEAKGYEVVTAVDGVDAFEKLETVSPDLITLDMNMPRMNGVEFYTKLKGDEDKPVYPVLILTARANMEQLFKDLDVDGFIPKPFEIDQLIAEAEDVMKKRKRSTIVAGKSEEARARKVCIVDDDKEELGKIALKLLDAGYIINSASSGASAIKRIEMDIPDVVVIKQNLSDINGDIVVFKLEQSETVKDIKCVLFDTKVGSNASISDAIGNKSGVSSFIGTSDPNDILIAVDDVFN